MSRSPAPLVPDPGGPTAEDHPSDGPGPRQESKLSRRRSSRSKRWFKLVGLASIAGILALAVAGYRKHQERRIVRLSVTRAQHLLRADTWLGYHEAATLLGLRAAAVDPVRAGSLRAFALAMLALDYRDEEASSAARTLTLEATAVPDRTAEAYLAAAALALKDLRAGTAVELLSRAGETASAQVLTARVALVAGNTAAATEAAGRALALDPSLPSALALRGDLLRRAGRAAEARDAYAGALREASASLEAGTGSSPAAAGATAPHARAAFGLAKLALSREVPAPEATAVLAKLVTMDDAALPRTERARGAMYLSALQARLGDRTGATATLEQAPVERDHRGWLERASGQLEVGKGRYRVPDGTPAALASASDDDPYVPPPSPPPKVEQPPRRQKLYGFKVHPVARHRVKAKPTSAKPPHVGSATKKPASKVKKPVSRGHQKNDRRG